MPLAVVRLLQRTGELIEAAEAVRDVRDDLLAILRRQPVDAFATKERRPMSSSPPTLPAPIGAADARLAESLPSAEPPAPLIAATPPAAPKVEGTPVERQAETRADGDDAGSGRAEAVGGQAASEAITTLVRVPALSEKQYLILETMKELVALSADTRQSAEVITVACDGKQADVNVFKPLLSDLTKNHKLTESKTGRGGGSWLNDSGVEVVNRLVENRKASVPKR